MINYYHTKFKLQADETMKRVALINKVLEADDIHTLKRVSMLPLSQQRKRINRLIEGEEDNSAEQMQIVEQPTTSGGKNNNQAGKDSGGSGAAANANSATLSNPL